MSAKPSATPVSDGVAREESEETRPECQDGGPSLAGENDDGFPRRKRTSRACDSCRLKKVKCNGQQPCQHCVGYGAARCTFDKPSHRRKANPVLQGVRALEGKLQRARLLLRELMPPSDPRFAQLDFALSHEAAPPQTPVEVDRAGPAAEDERFIPLVEGIGELDLGDDGKWDYHGLSSGAAYFGRIMKDFPELLSHDPRTPFLPQAPRPYMALPLGSLENFTPGLGAHQCYYELPPQDLARTLCEYSLSCATCVLRTVHIPSFYQRFDHLYNTALPSQAYDAEHRRFQGLLYAVLALGSMYDVDEKDPTNPNHYAVAMDRGFKFYISARLCLDDLTECGDMTTLQALVFITLFLQATANLRACHTFVGIAVRSALRMGLHRHLPHARMSPIEVETRRRVFHVIRQMDIYLSTTLGLPLLLQDKDIDQPLPTEVDDGYITEYAILSPPPSTPSLFQAFNAHAKLIKILAKVVEHLYPPIGIGGGASDVTYMISFTRIKETELDLYNWMEQLPLAWRPGPGSDIQVTRIQVLLRFQYAHVQMMLYRPFLRRPSVQDTPDQLTEVTQACQATGISVCRNIIHIGLEVRKQHVLIGPHWFMMYTEFLAVVSLILYVLNNPTGPTCVDILRDAQLGRAAIRDLTQRSLPADRMAVALDSLFAKLPDSLAPISAVMPNDVPEIHVSSFDTQGGIGGTETFGSDQQPNAGLAASVPSPDARMFTPEDPFAYPHLEEFGTVETNEANVVPDSTQLPLFPDLCGVTEAQLLDPLELMIRDPSP
ncbi:fungal-specific transcription factor domain-containing protein [Immersiella caudata]|uniref:Fungal-specific transcription factor domain-containing protein n=1 Tax=Immersiella caudata TaxID=314043 RepID=A0AA39TTM4_9PEZI|nr:fungal-specific transcription factor domain-containing protein [Immersiella caudata]